MTLKTKAVKGKKAGDDGLAQLVSTGFTVAENFIMDQADVSKKAKLAAKGKAVEKEPVQEDKMGKMFKKKKKTDNGVEDRGGGGESEQVAEADAELDGFAAPKPPKPQKKVLKRKQEDGDDGEVEKKKLKPLRKEVKMQQKTTKEERKKKGDGGNRYELSMKVKRIWEDLRREDTPKDKQLTLSATLYNMVKGHAKELVFAHDTCRAIECLFSTAPVEIRQAMFKELKEHTLNMAKSQYAHHYILKVLRHGSKDQRDHIIQCLSGRVVPLMRHKLASKILETAYNDWANASQRALLAQEFYGPEFKLFKESDVTTLDAALKKHPEKKEAFLKFMNQSIEPIIAKGVFNHSLLHRLLNEYLTHCGKAERAEMIQNFRQGVLSVLHTRDGSRIALTCLWHGTTKDRKDIIKSFKGHVLKICQEEHGHMVLMAMMDCVDDTKLVYKAILSELTTHLKEVIAHEHGRKVILYLLAGRDRTYTHPQVVDILKQGDGNEHSKKDDAVRRSELLAYMSPALVECVVADPEFWLQNSSRCLLLAPLLKFCTDPGQAFQAIASIVCKPMDQDIRNALSTDKEKVNCWPEQSAVHMVLKKIIQHDKQRQQPPYFASAIIANLSDKEDLMAWLACNRGAFLLVAAHETDVESVQKELARLIKPVRKYLMKQSNKGADVLDSKLSDSFVE